MAGTPITFDVNDLQTLNILTQDIPHHANPDKQATDYPLMHSYQTVIPYVGYSGKTIPVSGELVANSITAMDALEDTFKGYFIGENKNLDIGHNGSTRRYIATAIDVDVQRPGGLAYATFRVTFRSTLPFGQDIAATNAVNQTARTGSGYSDAHTFGGSAFQSPIATFTYTALSVTGGGTATVIYGNSSTGQAISVTRIWSPGDVLVINSLTGVVTVNGVKVDFTGAFPKFAFGPGNVTYNDTFTTRTFNELVAYNAMWF